MSIHTCASVQRKQLKVFVFYTLHRCEETVSNLDENNSAMTHDYNVEASRSDRRASTPYDDSNISSIATRRERLCGPV